MEIKIRNAILNVLNNESGTSVMSHEELDIDSETCYEFISRHVKKLLSNSAAKEATFSAGSQVYRIADDLKNGRVYFKDASREICGRLFEIMLKNVEIPSADVLIALFDIKSDTYLAVLKLNYKECYTHEIHGESHAQLVKCRTVLPFDSGKVEEACLIPFDPMLLKLIEKPYPVDGESRNYFSELFLECEAEISTKEVMQILKDITEEISEKYYESDVVGAARIKNALIEEAEEEDGVLNIRRVAERTFEDGSAAQEYVELLSEAGLKPEVNVGEKYVRQQFGFQRIKADNGVEIKIPSYLLDGGDSVKIEKNADGTYTIQLNRLYNVSF